MLGLLFAAPGEADYDTSPMRWLADFFYILAGVLYLPVLLYQALFLGKNRGGWRERFGGGRRFEAGRPRIWIHAVSLGEINCTPLLVAGLRRAMPDVDVVISTTTDTGFARAVQLYGRDQVFRFPLDFSVVIAAVLRRVNPSMIILVELEVWYNLIGLATGQARWRGRADIPVVVVNGRLTERSARRFGLLGALGRGMFSRLAWVGAQDEAIAARFRTLGVADDRVEVTSSMKWDTADVADRVDGQEQLALALGIDSSRPVIVCGSTGVAEESLLLDAFRCLLRSIDEKREGGVAVDAKAVTRPLLVIVPRKPERFGEVARLIERSEISYVRRSEHADGASPADSADVDVILGDTMGELRKFYAIADVVVMGRTFVSMGGSDPMEAAALSRAIIVGPHYDNFRQPVDLLSSADAIRIVDDARELAPVLELLLGDSKGRSELGSRAREVVLQQKGATERTVARIAALLKTSAVADPATAAGVGASRNQDQLVSDTSP